MKYLFLLSIFIFQYSYSQTDCAWEKIGGTKYVEAKDTYKYVDYKKDDPTSVICYFYACKIRQDENWETVVVDKTRWDDDFINRMHEYHRFVFTAFRLEEKCTKEEKKISFNVRIVVSNDEFKYWEGFNDEVFLQKKGSKWKITRIKEIIKTD